ncbi:hypothetical protein BaRGS_00031253, partial [Batillaria attramentaria]
HHHYHHGLQSDALSDLLAVTLTSSPLPEDSFHSPSSIGPKAPARPPSAVKECEKNGTWRHHAESGKPYSNYTMCTGNIDQMLDEEELKHSLPLYIFIAGYCVSIIMVLLSLVIFFAFRQLRCERITVHKNLFVSYILTGVTWILYYVLVALDGDVLFDNPVWCRVLHVLAHYCTASNFAWMFCEGLYLHVIMAQAFRTGKTLIRVLLLVGWVGPLILTIIYACVRELCSPNDV